MTVLDFPQTLSDRIDYLLRPAVERPTARGPLSGAEITAWQELVDEHLPSWAQDPNQLSDDDFEPPTAEIVQLALRIARVLRDQNVQPPDRVVPNGDGGIVFRWRSGDFVWSLELEADGSLETLFLEHDSLLSRHSLHNEPSR